MLFLLAKFFVAKVKRRFAVLVFYKFTDTY